MQLNEILEENSVKAISVKTNISEDNIESLIAENFASLPRAKTLGFFSIIEREYDADLTAIVEQAKKYYLANNKEQSISLGMPGLGEQKGRSVWSTVLVLGLLTYASWYFFTQFDKKNISTILPFINDKVETTTLPSDDTVEADLSINNALSSTHTDSTGVQTDIVEMSLEPNKRQDKARN